MILPHKKGTLPNSNADTLQTVLAGAFSCRKVASMADEGARARNAGAAAFVGMTDEGAGARIAGAAAFVSMAY